MNGVHDMGGMQGMGPIQYEKNEPVFHERWEARLFALNRSMGAWRKWNIDASRFQREQIPAAEYLRMSYYEKWLAGLVELMVKTDLVTPAEIESGTPSPSSPKQIPPLTVDKVLPGIARGAPARSVNCAFPNRPKCPCAKYKSRRSHAPTTIRARKIWND